MRKRSEVYVASRKEDQTRNPATFYFDNACQHLPFPIAPFFRLRSLCAMRNDYPKGMRFKMMVDGKPGLIISLTLHAYGRYKYYVVMDGEQMPTEVGIDEILPVDHPWHEKMIEWRANGIRQGYTCIVVGLSRTGFRVFYCNDEAGYRELIKRNPGVHMKYFWKL